MENKEKMSAEKVKNERSPQTQQIEESRGTEVTSKVTVTSSTRVLKSSQTSPVKF